MSVCGCKVTGLTAVVWGLGRGSLEVVESVLSLSLVVTSGTGAVVVGALPVTLSVGANDFVVVDVVVVDERVGPVIDVVTLVVALGLGGTVLVFVDVTSPGLTGNVTALVVEVTLCVAGTGVVEVSG